MGRQHHRVRVLTLAREEIRALPRQTFGMAAVAAILAILAPLYATSFDGPSAVRDYLVFLWVVAELAVAIVVAARVAAARRTRFVDSLYTTPLEARTWLGAQVLVGLFLAGLVLLAQVPYVLVHIALVGIPPDLPALLLAGIGAGVFAVVLGIFCGVIVGGVGPGAAAGMAGGFGFLSFILFIIHSIAGAGPPTPTVRLLLHVSALSPLSLLVDAARLDIFGTSPDEPWRGLVGYLALVVGLGGAAWLAYTRAQGPLGWEPRAVRVPIVALVALALVVPVATASVSFHEVEDEDDKSYVFIHGEHTRIAFVPRGAPITEDSFSLDTFYDQKDLEHGRDNELDVLVMLVVAEDESVRNVRVQVSSGDGLQVVSGGRLVVPDGEPDGRARAMAGFSWNAEPTGPPRPVYRIPVVLRPVEAYAVLGSPNIVHIDTTFAKDGRTLESAARLTLQSDMPGAPLALLLAGAPLPLAAVGGIVTRRIKTR